MDLTELPQLHQLAGEFHGHVFENPRAGVPRNVYWSLTLDFAPIKVGNSEWPVSMMVEWLTFDARRWTELASSGLSDIADREQVETSIYFFDTHQDAELEALHLRRLGANRFEVVATAACELETLEGTRLPRTSISWRGEVELDGIYIVRENLFPKPSSPEEATAVLGAFLAPADFSPPELDDGRWVFRPTG